MAGRAGSSRRSCLQLITYVHSYEYQTLSLTKDYSLKEFKKDLKIFFEVATVQQKTCVLFIEDY